MTKGAYRKLRYAPFDKSTVTQNFKQHGEDQNRNICFFLLHTYADTKKETMQQTG